MKVLLIEDDPSISFAIRIALQQKGDHTCDVVESGADAIEITKLYPYDVIILDLGLPDRSGQEVLRALRDLGFNMPVLVLSANQDIKTKIASLGIGADDYMIKPFHQQELMARLKALVRRSEGHSSSKIKVGELTIDLEKGVLYCADVPMRLTSTEYKIMESFMLKPGSTLKKSHLMDRLYGGTDEPEPKIIDVFICKMRSKMRKILGPVGARYIETVWGRGYILQEPSQEENTEEMSFETNEALTDQSEIENSEEQSSKKGKKKKVAASH